MQVYNKRSDSRLAALATGASGYLFQSPDGPIAVTAAVIFRGAFIVVTEQK